MRRRQMLVFALCDVEIRSDQTRNTCPQSKATTNEGMKRDKEGKLVKRWMLKDERGISWKTRGLFCQEDEAGDPFSVLSALSKISTATFTLPHNQNKRFHVEYPIARTLGISEGGIVEPH